MAHVALSNSKLDLFSLRKTSKTLATIFNLFEIFIIDFSMGALCSESTLTSWVPPSRALIPSFLSRSPLALIVPTNDPLLSRSLSSQVERVIHTIPCIKHHKNCESCLTQKVKFRCQICRSCLACPGCPVFPVCPDDHGEHDNNENHNHDSHDQFCTFTFWQQRAII